MTRWYAQPLHTCRMHGASIRLCTRARANWTLGVDYGASTAAEVEAAIVAIDLFELRLDSPLLVHRYDLILRSHESGLLGILLGLPLLVVRSVRHVVMA